MRKKYCHINWINETIESQINPRRRIFTKDLDKLVKILVLF